MKIGIDARFLTHPQMGGFKTYTTNLLSALAQADRQNHYVIYVDRQAAAAELPGRGRFDYRVVSSSLPVVGMPVREQIFLRRQIQRDRPDFMHFLCNTAPVGINRPYVVTLHDVIQLTAPNAFSVRHDLAAHKRWAMTEYSKQTILRTIRNADQIITVSGSEKRAIVNELHIAPERIAVTHLGPNPIYGRRSPAAVAQWQSENSARLGLPQRFVLGVGYEARKNLPLLIEAFAQLAPELPDLGLVLVSSNSERNAYFRQYSAELGIGERVAVITGLSNEGLAMLYNLAAVFVFPSEREGFGLPPLEAAACGAPTIAMHASSLPEVMEDGALWVKGKNVADWANAIRLVITEDNVRQALIQKGLARAGQLSWQRCAARTLQVYSSMATAAGLAGLPVPQAPGN